MYLVQNEIKSLIASEESDRLVIRPLLEESQVGAISVDFRLGYDFLVSKQGREAFIDTSQNNPESARSVGNFFDRTRRRPGETFLLHPSQTILASSLEYIKLPSNIYMELNMRSSYARLGITISTIVQPGYCGCISLELTNASNNPINLTIGSRVVQARFIKLEKPSNYFRTERKYICQVRPIVSAVSSDSDLEVLHRYWKELNNRNDTSRSKT